jgi:predicted ATPase/AraC-like DNA-binding protein
MSGGSVFLDKAARIVEENLINDQFGANELALELGMSRSTLHRKLHAATGLSASRYIRSLRLEKAMGLLKDASLNITDIAFACGFHSITYFDQCFKDHYGITPLQTRSGLSTETLKNENRNQIHHFPLPATSFIGREKQINELTGLLDHHRIVSLVGPGGCGKTRLACEVARRYPRYIEGGIWFVDLAPIHTVERVVKEVLETLHIPEVPGQDLMETLITRLRDETLLIILDNCEHQITTCALLAKRLVRSAPGIRILVTSREILGVSEEIIWKIPPLQLIEPDVVTGIEVAGESEAVRLFADRAQLSDPRFALSEENIREVVTICHRTEGFPLAIELVAGRIRFMDPVILLERLSERFSEIPSPDPRISDRQKTMHATIAWSYHLLTGKEQQLFKRLSVFSDGFDLYAIEKVCSDDSIQSENMLDLLSRLVEKSMVFTIREQGQPMRYQMLETLKQHGAGLLRTTEEKQLRQKHLAYYVELADRAYKERLISQNQWITTLHRENNNLVAALFWSEQHDQKQFTRLAGSLAWFWNRSNNYTIAARVQEKALSEDPADKEAYARILSGYGVMLSTSPDQIQSGIELLHRGRKLWEELNNRAEEAIVVADLALVAYAAGNNESGLTHARKAYTIAQTVNEPATLLYCMLPLSQGLVNLKHFDEARAMAMNILTEAESQGNYFARFAGHHHLADCALMEGKYLESEREYGTGIETVMKFQDVFPAYMELTGIAMSVSGQGRYAKALRLNAAASEAARRSGGLIPEKVGLPFWQEQLNIHLNGARKKLGETLAARCESEGRAMGLQEAITYALDYEKN